MKPAIGKLENVGDRVCLCPNPLKIEREHFCTSQAKLLSAMTPIPSARNMSEFRRLNFISPVLTLT